MLLGKHLEQICTTRGSANFDLDLRLPPFSNQCVGTNYMALQCTCHCVHCVLLSLKLFRLASVKFKACCR